MKFLCDKCKAKYQIADDKLVGKTVRMKCRKCEHLIEVRAAVTETSIAASLPPRAPLATSLAHAKAPAARPTVRPRASAGTWYAAIDGAPVGPMSVAELRERCAEGAIRGDALVWEEGTDEWRAARTVPALATLFRDAARPSPAAPSVRGGGAARAQGPSLAPRPATRVARDAPHPGQIAAQAHVAAYASGAATAEKLELEVAPAPSPEPTPAPVPAPMPVAATQELPAPPPPAVQPAPQRQTNYLGIGIVVGIAAFGITLALTFQRQAAPLAPLPPTIITIPAPQQAPAPVTAVRPTPAPTATPKAPAPPSARGPKPAPAAKQDNVPALPGGLLPGPGPGPDVAPAPKTGGGSISQGQLEATINGRKAAVKRVCFDRLGAGAGNANETVRITIDGSGHVTNVSADGNNGTVGRCLEKEIGRWPFPASGGTTEVSVPFHFVLQ
jgi:predicted Zn finger-like uncharacterized protein